MLSVEDKLAIEELYARYYWAIDTGDAEAFVSTYAEDGVFEPPTNQVTAGRDALRTWVAGRIAFRKTEATTNGQHWITNLVLEGDGQSARGRCYFMRTVQSRETLALAIEVSGWCADELRKVDGAWRFQRRKVFRQMPQHGATK